MRKFVALYGRERNHLFATFVSNPLNIASQNLQLRRAGGKAIATIDFLDGKFGFNNFQRTLVAHNIENALALACQFDAKVSTDVLSNESI